MAFDAFWALAMLMEFDCRCPELAVVDSGPTCAPPERSLLEDDAPAEPLAQTNRVHRTASASKVERFNEARFARIDFLVDNIIVPCGMQCDGGYFRC
jgi:hypothetical protein